MEEGISNQLICRVCLTDKGDFQTLFASIMLGESQENILLSKIICSFANIQIAVEDDLPQHICISCAEDTIKMYYFKLRCEESDRLLRQRLLNLKNSPSPDTREKPIVLTLSNVDTQSKLLKSDSSKFVLQEYDYSDDFDYDADVQIKCEQEEPVLEKVKKFECSLCFKRFSRQDLLLRHKIAHVKKMGEYKEKTEEEMSSSNDEMDKIQNYNIEIDGTFNMDHDTSTIVVNQDGTLRLHPCKKCNDVFTTKDMLDFHLNDQHKDVEQQNKNIKKSLIGSLAKLKLSCSSCDETFKEYKDYRKHVKDFECLKKFSCPHCFMKYFKKGHLNNHLKIHEEIDKEKSNDGKLQFEKKDNVRKPHICEICFKAFNQISNLKDHLRTHNGEKPFLCPSCGKGFNQLGNLRQHQVRHSGVKSHLCNTCGSGFASKGELQTHIRKHTGARPFVCDTCGMGFTTSSSLTKHKRIHSGEKPYECDVCKMKFSRSGILSRHKRIHTGIKPYKCEYCSKGFTQSNDLNSHLRIHTGEKPYICDECGQAFRQTSALRSHKKSHQNSSNSLRKATVKREGNIFVEEEMMIMP